MIPKTIAQEHGTAQFRLVFNFGIRHTFLAEGTTRVFGLSLGAQRDKHLVAVGTFGLGNPSIAENARVPGLGMVRASYEINYTSVIYERILLDTRKWRLSVPISVGFGLVKTNVPDSLDMFRLYSEREVVPIEASFDASFKLFYWLYLNAGVGYRSVRSNDAGIDRIYSNATWSYGLGIKFGALFRRLTKPEKRRMEGR